MLGATVQNPLHHGIEFFDGDDGRCAQFGPAILGIL